MTAPDPATVPVRSTDTDWLLELLTSMADAGQFRVAVTVWTAAGVVTGELVGGPVWIRALREQVRAAGTSSSHHFADDLAAVEDAIFTQAASRATSGEPPGFLHLVDAVTLFPGGMSFSHGLWRGRFVDVTGWTLGRPPLSAQPGAAPQR